MTFKMICSVTFSDIKVRLASMYIAHHFLHSCEIFWLFSFDLSWVFLNPTKQKHKVSYFKMLQLFPAVAMTMNLLTIQIGTMYIY